MSDYKTKDKMAVMTTKPYIILIAAFIISIIFLNFFLLVFLLSSFAINLQIFFVGFVVFLVSIVSILIIKAEIMLAIKNNYKHKPPLAIFLLFIFFYFILLIILPESIMGQSKTSPIILLFLILPNLTLTVILYIFYYFLFMKLITIIPKIGTKEILSESDFLEKINFKTKETQRYSGTFSLILITFIVPDFAAKELKQTKVFSFFSELVKKSIRNTDILGICGNGNIAAVLSNNNNLKKAQTQTKRIITTIKKNSLFMKKIEVYKAEFVDAISEYSREIATGHELFEQTVKKIEEKQHRYWEHLLKNGNK